MKINIRLTFILIVSLGMYCCSNIPKKVSVENIKGNWFLKGKTISGKDDYREIYFDDQTMYIFISATYQITYANNYFLKADKIIFLDNQRKDTLGMLSVKYRKENLKIIGEDGEVYLYKKIFGESALSDLISGKISKEIYDKAFTERMGNVVKGGHDQ